MNIRLVRDLLIDAVRLDRETHDHIGPAPLRGQQLPYAHGFSDMAGWGKVPNDFRCQLRTEDGDPLATIRHDFWDQYDRDPSPAEISRADTVHGWVSYIDVDAERRALLGWLKSKVGGRAFKRWCASEGISTTTGTKRKNRALDKILAELARRPVQDYRLLDFGVLHLEPEISDVSATIAEGAGDATEGLNNWAAADALPDQIEFSYKSDRTGNRGIEIPQSEFSWAARRNERRRRQRAKKAAKKAKAKS
ncbi:hypothetical protein GGQ99_004774 [Aminobacter niigataensis]|uniref:Uncharacterized protein n=1 Tax=Aminobacter niigataensis TaxID=83265 RepID=A0ABR6L8C3_9HYPH|nr:hypothetical protein [Aminobacter niigataensis]MBB4652990.1 hypothetical protein [Aminobacter niigataensis]